MTTRKTYLAAAIIAGLALAGTSIATAQTPPGPGGQGRMMGQSERGQTMSDHREHDRRGAPMRADRRAGNDRIEGRIAFLKAEMKITAGQEEPWNRLAEALRTQSRRTAEAQSLMPARDANLTIAQRLSLRERQMSAMLEGVRAVATAMGPLEAVLTDDQKRTLNELGPMGMGGRGPMPGRGGRR
jgi:LTXXQ motif family protein